MIDLDQQRISRDGRAVNRRLNRYEYENSLRDLLHLPWLQIRDTLPEDGELHRYNKVGEALDVSHVHLSRYMNAADNAIRQAIIVRLDRPQRSSKRYYARDEFSLAGNFWPRENGTLPDRLSFPVLDSRAQPDVRSGEAPKSTPDTREREAVGRVSSIFSDAGGYSWGQFRVPASGRYKLRFKGYSIWSAAEVSVVGSLKVSESRRRLFFIYRFGIGLMLMKFGQDEGQSRSVSMPKALARADRSVHLILESSLRSVS